MKSINLIAILFLLFGKDNVLLSQDFGYLGKKNKISFSTTSCLRTMMRFTEMTGDFEDIGYRVLKYDQNNVLKESRKFLRYDLRIGYSRQLSTRVALGAEFSFEEINMARDKYYGKESLYMPYSTPVTDKYGGYLTLSFTARNRIPFISFSSEFGLGPTFYNFDRDQNYRLDEKRQMNYTYPNYVHMIRGVNAFWEPGLHVPFTRFLILDLAVRVQSGWVFDGDIELKNGDKYYSDALRIINSSDEYYNEQLEVKAVWTKTSVSDYLRVDAITHIFACRFGISIIL